MLHDGGPRAAKEVHDDKPLPELESDFLVKGPSGKKDDSDGTTSALLRRAKTLIQKSDLSLDLASFLRDDMVFLETFSSGKAESANIPTEKNRAIEEELRRELSSLRKQVSRLRKDNSTERCFCPFYRRYLNQVFWEGGLRENFGFGECSGFVR